MPVIAGCGSNDTRVAIRNIKKAEEVGADAGLFVPPYYNRPNQDGIYKHFEALAAASDLSIMLYNVPSRTVTDIAVDTIGPAEPLSRHRRHQGCDRRSCPRHPAPVAMRRGILPAFGQRRSRAAVQCIGRRRLRLGHRKRCAEALRRFSGGICGGRSWRGAGAPRPAVPLAQGALRRRFARTGQIRADEGAQRVSRRTPPADDVAVGRGAKGGRCGAGTRRAQLRH